MNMRQTLAALGCVLLTCGFASAGDRWLHVRIQDRGYDDEAISINVPLSMIEALVPRIETGELGHGRIHWDGDHSRHGIDLYDLLLAVRDAPDSEFITVRRRDESVRVAKENGLLLVHIDEDGGDRVRVRVPIEVVEALVRTDRDELDLAAALRALADYDVGDFVVVDSDDETVRIWIDSSETGD